jgi:ribonuclease III
MPVKKDSLQRAESILGHTFADPHLLKEALTHSSVADTRLQSNERMEFLGDAVLDLIICEALYQRYPQYMEGDMTKIKSAVVSRQTCAEVSNETGLTGLLVTAKGVGSGRSMPGSLAAAVYESIVAALYLDGGFEVAKKYILDTMGPKITAIAEDTCQHNYKALLQQHAQKHFNGSPTYELLDEKGPDHSKCFEVCVAIDGRRYESAWGPNKKMAEQKAALMALREMGILDQKHVDEAMDHFMRTESGDDE